MFTNCSVSIFENSPRRTTRRVVLWLLLSASTYHSCKETPPETQPTPFITLTALDASCTEAWLKASTTETPATVRLLRDGQRTSDFRLLTSDSLLLDEGLLPRRTYTYQLQKLNADSSVAETSASVNVTTMDTTSHNFTFQIDTLGDGASSVLNDVAVLNDSLAYAVGELYKRDSVGGFDPLPYNIARWNGQRWDLQRATVQTRFGILTLPLEGISAFSPTDIWAMAGDPLHFNGIGWTDYDIRVIFGDPSVSVSKGWGMSSSEMYFVGKRGKIVHYNGSWQQLASGTQADIQGAWGKANRLAGGQGILFPASNIFTFSEKKLLRLSVAGIIDSLPWGMNDRRLKSVWFDTHSKIYVCGGGVFAYSGKRWREFTDIPLFFTEDINGNAENDLFVVGDFGLVAHYNGVSWKVYPSVDNAVVWESVAMKMNKAIAVGWSGARARVLRITR